MAKENKEQHLEVELLKAQLETLKAQVGERKKTSDEEFAERVAKYEASISNRDAQKQEIMQRRMLIMQRQDIIGRCTMEDAAILEAYERRSKQCENTDMNHSIKLMNAFKEKIREIKARL